jgi:6-phosphofructokinase
MSDFALAGKHVNVAMMTSGGLAPCLSSSVSLLAKYWVEAYRAGKISGLTLRMYKDGYKGVLIGDSFIVPENEWDGMEVLNFIGGSPIGNSRVKVRKTTTIQKCLFYNLPATSRQTSESRPKSLLCFTLYS